MGLLHHLTSNYLSVNSFWMADVPQSLMDGGPYGCQNTPNCPCLSPSRAELPNTRCWQEVSHLQGETKPTVALPAPLWDFATALWWTQLFNVSLRNWESPGQVSRLGLELYQS